MTTAAELNRRYEPVYLNGDSPRVYNGSEVSYYQRSLLLADDMSKTSARTRHYDEMGVLCRVFEKAAVKKISLESRDDPKKKLSKRSAFFKSVHLMPEADDNDGRNPLDAAYVQMTRMQMEQAGYYVSHMRLPVHLRPEHMAHRYWQRDRSEGNDQRGRLDFNSEEMAFVVNCAMAYAIVMRDSAHEHLLETGRSMIMIPHSSGFFMGRVRPVSGPEKQGGKSELFRTTYFGDKSQYSKMQEVQYEKNFAFVSEIGTFVGRKKMENDEALYEKLMVLYQDDKWRKSLSCLPDLWACDVGYHMDDFSDQRRMRLNMKSEAKNINLKSVHSSLKRLSDVVSSPEWHASAHLDREAYKNNKGKKQEGFGDDIREIEKKERYQLYWNEVIAPQLETMDAVSREIFLRNIPKNTL